jgi:hypothetical protein
MSRDRLAPICCAHLGMFHLNTETEFSLRNVVFYIYDRRAGRWVMPRVVTVVLVHRR